MKNYYQILGVDQDASEFKVFKEFRKRYIKLEQTSSDALEVLTAYLILQGSGRKYYDIVFKQVESGKTPNTKYLGALENIEIKARELFSKQKENPQLFSKPLEKYPFFDSLSEVFGLLLEVEIGWTTIGITLVLVSIITSGFYLSQGDLMILLLSAPIMVLGILMHNHGVLKYRKEKLEEICQKTTST